MPEALREQVNVRLRNGDTGRVLAAWLNGLPEVQALLIAEFQGKPVREQNISEWRRGGHQQWLRVQEAYTMMKQISAEGTGVLPAAAVNGTEQESATHILATWVTARYLVAAKSAEGMGEDKPAAWNRMREFCHDVLALRRVDLRGRRLDWERERRVFKRGKTQTAVAQASCLRVHGASHLRSNNQCGAALPRSPNLRT